MTLFVPKYFDRKLNFCCNEWYISANTIDSVKNFAFIKNITIKNFTDMNSLCGCESVADLDLHCLEKEQIIF